MNTVDTSEMTFNQFCQTQHDYIGYQSLTDVPRACVYTEEISTDLVVSVKDLLGFYLKKKTKYNLFIMEILFNLFV